MTNLNKTSGSIEENYYQILDVPNTASLVEIRQAYEGKLEEAHLEAFAAYSLLPEEESEEKLLQFSHAYITLANPIARAKYDDELNQHNIPDKKKSDLSKNDAERIISETLKMEYSALYRTHSEYNTIFKQIGFSLLRAEDMFEEGSLLNKYSETRLRLYLFKQT